MVIFRSPLWCLALALLAWPAPIAAQQVRYTSAQEQQFYESGSRALAHGAFDEAERLAASRADTDPSGGALRARLLIERGRYADAEALLKPIAQANPATAAGLELGLLLTSLGRDDEAGPFLNAVVELGARSRRALDQFRAGLAARALGRYRDANTFIRSAQLSVPSDPSIQTAWGELFWEKYNQPDALKSFGDALTLDAGWAPAHLGLARAVADDDPPAARASADQALAINPSYEEAHLFIAELELNESDRDAARAAIDRALAINPNSLKARALLAAIARLEDRQADFEAEIQRALAINPSYGEAYRIVGERLAINYRFDEAVAAVRRAVALDPGQTRAYADLGMHLLRTGDEPGARAALERAFAEDPFDVITYNLLGMLDTLTEFETIESGDLIVRLHRDEAPVLQEYVVALAQEALDSLEARYQFQVTGPILVEVFPRHDDFAVRNLGLPGMIGALGACFGRVVTMDSPRAQQPGEFNWQSTLWHEMAHVVTLQMSKQRMPRWLSEGISVYEEKRARPEWGRDQALVFARALNAGEALKLADLNSGFQRPEMISLAYFHASVLVEHLIESNGEAALHTMLRAYGEGVETEEALARIGLDFDALQASFDTFVEARFGALRRALQSLDRPLPEPGPGERLAALRRLAEDTPDSFALQMALGEALVAAGELENAMRAFARAAELAPMATGDESPRLMLADLAVKLGDRERAIAELARFLEHDHTSVEPVRRLAALAEEVGDEAKMELAYRRLVGLDPFDATPHQAIGRLALARGDARAATREFRVALAIGPVDRVTAHCDLAESYLLAGQRDEAKRQALAALEIAPTYERAQELLLRVVEGQ